MASFINKAEANLFVDGNPEHVVSNEVVATGNVSCIKMVKEQDKNIVASGDEMTYTIRVTNNSKRTTSSFKFTDVIPDGMSFVTNSLTIDKRFKEPTITGQTLTFTLQELKEGETVIAFKTLVL